MSRVLALLPLVLPFAMLLACDPPAPEVDASTNARVVEPWIAGEVEISAPATCAVEAAVPSPLLAGDEVVLFADPPLLDAPEWVAVWRVQVDGTPRTVGYLGGEQGTHPIAMGNEDLLAEVVVLTADHGTPLCSGEVELFVATPVMMD